MTLFLLNVDTLHLINDHVGKEGISSETYIYTSLAFLFIIFLIIVNWNKIKILFSRIKPSEYEINIPGFTIKGTVRYNAIEQELAWKVYVELITRVSGNFLDERTGILRETLQSLYKLFDILRETLKNSNVELAKKLPDALGQGKTGDLTIASLLILIMNNQLRPFLSKWHPLLLEHEKKRSDQVSQFEHEEMWEHNLSFRSDLKILQSGLSEYINSLKSIAEGAKK